MHPLTEQCTATSRRSGLRCQRLVKGGGVCVKHGGGAPQVRAKREARLIAGEAALSATREPRDAGEVLSSAMTDADAILQRLKTNVVDGQFRPADLAALGEWIDRAARISKTMVDAKLDARRVALSEAQGQLIATAIRAILARLTLTAEQQLLVPVVVPEELRRLAAAENA